MRVSAAVQHHPSRASLLPPLLAALGSQAEVVADPDPGGHRSAWRTYQAALERTPAWATHRLIVQDDAQPCYHFAEVITRAVEARPDRLLILCVCGLPALNVRDIFQASDRGWSWAEYRIQQLIVPTIAVVWPVRLIEPTLTYIAGQGWQDDFTADDERVARTMRALRETPLATVPSLVDHPDTVESLCLKKPKYGNPARTTACFVPDGCDPRTIDWSLGPA